MSKVRLGIIGVGYWGPNLVRSFFQLDDCQVDYVCDKDATKLNLIGKSYPGLILTKNIKRLLEDKALKAVVVATPADTHTALAKQILKAGKHVLIEKPLCLSVKEAKSLVKLAKKQKKILMVGHTYEYNPVVIKIKEYLAKKKLGKLFYVYGSRVNLGKVREETNALWNLAPHDFSMLRFLIGKMPQRVSAFGRAYLQKDHEDVVFINLKFPGGIVANIHTSWLDPSKERKWTLVGSKKMLVFDDMDNEAPIRIYDKGVVKPGFGEFHVKLRPGDIHLPYIEPKEPLREECAHFINCIKNNQQPRSDGLSGLQVVKMLEAAQMSLDKGGKWVEII